MKTQFALAAAVLLWATGCQQMPPSGHPHAETSHPRPRPVEPPPAENPPPVAPTPAKPGCADATPGFVKLSKTMPSEVALGAEMLAELHVTAQTCVGNVIVRDPIPANVTYVRSEPAATVDGNVLLWALGDLDSGESREIKVWLKPAKEGAIVNCATVSSDPRACAVTRVVNPAIKLFKSEPSDVVLCDPIPVTLAVQNTGSSKLTGVKVTDTLPPGLTSEGQSNLSFDAGVLAPGERKEIKFNAVASAPGKYVNAAKATAEQGVSATAGATTLVHQAVLSIACKAREQQYLGRTFDVCLDVSNAGDAISTGTQVALPIPSGLTLKSATTGGHVAGESVVWDIGALAVNAPQELCATFVSANSGTFAFNGVVKGACAAAASSACSTRVIGIPAILLEKSDDPDPVAVGETTTYTVKITNQGSADDNNIHMVVTIAPELVPVSATGNGTIEGQKVHFPEIPRLAPKEAITYKIVAKGVKGGDGHTKFTLDSQMLTSPLQAEESTHVY